MPRHTTLPPKPERIAGVVRALASGRSTRDVAAEYAIDEKTARNWQRDYAARMAEGKQPGGRFHGIKPIVFDDSPEVIPPASAAETRLERMARKAAEPAPPVDDGETLSLLEQVRQLQREMLTTAKEAKAVGNTRGAQAALASAGLLSNTILRISKTEAEGAAVLKISREEIMKRRAKVRERMRSICDRPLLCSECNRKLSVLWGTGKELVEEPAAAE